VKSTGLSFFCSDNKIIFGFSNLIGLVWDLPKIFGIGPWKSTPFAINQHSGLEIILLKDTLGSFFEARDIFGER